MIRLVVRLGGGGQDLHTSVNSKYTETITPMITAYDWVKPARHKTTLKRTQESFQGARNGQEVCF